MNKIEITYEIDDGYISQKRPHNVIIRKCDLPEDFDELTDEEKNEIIEEFVKEDFNKNISWYITNKKVL